MLGDINLGTEDIEPLFLPIAEPTSMSSGKISSYTYVEICFGGTGGYPNIRSCTIIGL
jgi:hypothetical protein